MSEAPTADRRLVDAAIRRISILIAVLTVVGTVGAALRWGTLPALQFAAGGTFAYINFRWIVALVDAMLRTQKAKPSRSVYAKLLLPLVLLGAVLYVIFSRSESPPVGFFAGLSLLVAGVLIEALYQLLGESRR